MSVECFRISFQRESLPTSAPHSRLVRCVDPFQSWGDSRRRFFVRRGILGFIIAKSALLSEGVFLFGG
jgi:hypothetical protein